MIFIFQHKTHSHMASQKIDKKNLIKEATTLYENIAKHQQEATHNCSFSIRYTQEIIFPGLICFREGVIKMKSKLYHISHTTIALENQFFF